ncbi:hypothetical protein [Pseudoalteromonas denitrificans]|uniref:Uncharacterized protein n=1 Tax=Pseudoalteromonas denitrificans DSM 6059 TaxID=1123010 RepID=A0A1I1Q411_9GAMM|nr:hypothetical protein [Pseudoalteromonas denitrificans]SFD16702.1 hypothetical protein SAMN02745724_03725 [Pseudoalteromonas denitrificans DSM 6059]
MSTISNLTQLMVDKMTLEMQGQTPLSPEEQLLVAKALEAMKSNVNFETALVAVVEEHINESTEALLNAETAIITAKNTIEQASNESNITLLKQHYELLNGDMATVQFLLSDLTVEEFNTWLTTHGAEFNTSINAVFVAYKIFENASAVNAIVASADAMSKIASSSSAMSALVASSIAMSAASASSIAMSALVESSKAMPILAASLDAMTIVIASPIAMPIIVSSPTAMPIVAASTSAMSVIASSLVAMSMIVASPIVMSMIAASTVAISEINNSQLAKDKLYQIATKWTKSGSAWQTNTVFSADDFMLVRIIQKDNPAGWGVRAASGQTIKAEGETWTTTNAGSTNNILNENSSFPFIADDAVRVFKNKSLKTYLYNTYEIAYIKL